jgi:hypothetical protein
VLATAGSAVLHGIDGRPVRVEVHVSNGMPGFTVVGLPDTACRESRDRVRAALLSSSLPWPQRRTTVNLAPSSLERAASARCPKAGAARRTGRAERRVRSSAEDTGTDGPNDASILWQPVAPGGVTVSDPTVVTEEQEPDGSNRTVVGNTKGRSTSESGASGPKQTFQGRPTQNEANVVEAIHRLTDKLNKDEGRRRWTGSTASAHVSVDGTITSDDATPVELRCQVTRVERATLPNRGAHGAATSSNDIEALANAITDAVASKDAMADPDEVLVLDANDAPAYTDGDGPGDLAVQHCRDRGLLGRWSEIWLVGPTVPRTRRLDPYAAQVKGF